MKKLNWSWLDMFNIFPTPPKYDKTDSEAIAGDWKKVGNTFYSVMGIKKIKK